MITLAGKQKEFTEALMSLLELEYAATVAYEEALSALKDLEYCKKIEGFKKDHQHHITELNKIIRNLGYKPPKEGGFKELLTEGKVLFSELMGDKAILKALRSNEDDTNIAYERLNHHPKKIKEAENFLKKGLQDERKHRAWLEKILEEES